MKCLYHPFFNAVAISVLLALPMFVMAEPEGAGESKAKQMVCGEVLHMISASQQAELELFDDNKLVTAMMLRDFVRTLASWWYLNCTDDPDKGDEDETGADTVDTTDASS